MFVRTKADRHGHRHHQLVRSVRTGRTVRQHVLADLGQAPSLNAALRQWPAEIAHLRQRGAAARSAAERLRAQMPPTWVPGGVVPRPSRYGMRAANRSFGQYWAAWDRAAKLDRAADRLYGRLGRLCNIVEHEVGTTLTADDEPLREEA